MSTAFAPAASINDRTCGMCGHVNRNARSACVFCGEAMKMPSAEDGDVQLFSPMQIAATTFLGGLLGGFLVMGVNFLKLKRIGAALASVVVGALLLLGTVKLIVSTPALAKVPGMLMTIGMSVLMLGIASLVQKPAYDAHKANGGEMMKGAKSLLVVVPAIIVSALAGLAVVWALLPKGM